MPMHGFGMKFAIILDAAGDFIARLEYFERSNSNRNPILFIMSNPFTRNETEPINGPAIGPGQTGYVPKLNDGVRYGYTITGFGHMTLVINLTGAQ